MIERPVYTADHLPVSPPPVLIGRDPQLEQARQLLATHGSLWLYGTLGIGRRALAATLAKDYLNPVNGVLWFSVYHDDFLMLMNRVARAYGVSSLAGDEISTQIEMVQALLGKNRPLIVIEGPVASGVVSLFLQQCMPPSVIILASEHIDGNWKSLALEPLDDKSAEQLYRVSGEFDESRRTALLAPLLDYVEGHPLALVVAGKQSAHAKVTSTHFASILPKAPAGPENRALGVYAAAHTLLDAPTQGLFLLLGALFVDRINLPLLSTITHVPEAMLHNLLTILVERGLCDVIHVDGASTYRLHDLARIYARRRLKIAGQLESTRERISKGILSFVEKHTETHTEVDFDALSSDMDHVLGLARYAINELDKPTVEILFKLLGKHGTQNVIHVRGYLALYDRLGRMLTGKPLQLEPRFQMHPTGTFPLVKLSAEGDVIISRPSADALLNMSREALESAVDAAIERHDIYAAARLLMALGDWHVKHLQHDFAFTEYQRALGYYDSMGDAENLLSVLQKLASCSVKMERYQDGIQFVTRALELVTETQDKTNLADLQILLGDAKAGLQDREGAIKTYQETVQLLQTQGNLVNTGLALGKLATVYLDQGELQQATVVLAQSATLFEQASRRDLQGQALGNLGTAFGRMGRWREAGQRHMLALQIAREIEDVEEERYQLSNLAFVAEAENYVEWAIYYNRQALYLALIAGDNEEIAKLVFELGRLLMNDTKNLPQAIFLLEKSVDLAHHDEAVRLLVRLRTRLQRLRETGYQDFAFVQTDLQAYAQAAYEMSQ